MSTKILEIAVPVRLPEDPAPVAATAPADYGRAPIPRRMRRFLETEAAAGILLVVAACVALVWANLAEASYGSFWSTEVGLRWGDEEFSHDLHHWVNDALMALFFFVVALEIKRELVHGELRNPRVAAVPVVAALGGMVVPAGIFLVLNASGEGTAGWGIPMATDIAFAMAVVALLGERVPPPLKLFLLTLAVVDDVGAILVIALFYADGIDTAALGIAALALLCMGTLRRFEVNWMPAFFALGGVVWFGIHESGVHATIAGVVLGLLAPSDPQAEAVVARDWAADLRDDPSPEEVLVLGRVARAGISVSERLEYQLHPITSLVILPLFALANAGVVLDMSALTEGPAARVALGAGLGLVLGKLVGVSAASLLAIRAGWGTLPAGMRPSHVMAISLVAGIGFTVSLFISELAYPDSALLGDAAKVGVLAGSLLAAGLGALALWAATRDGDGAG